MVDKEEKVEIALANMKGKELYTIKEMSKWDFEVKTTMGGIVYCKTDDGINFSIARDNYSKLMEYKNKSKKN